jgi:putative endonuclease
VSEAGDSVPWMDRRADRGAAGEEAAASWYRERGFRIVARNWRCAVGEIDMVLTQGQLLVICEVKTRGGSWFGGGYEAVGRQKQRKLRQLAELFLRTWPILPAAVRFDVASVALGPRGASIEVFQDAF